jgi:hypothetical protein
LANRGNQSKALRCITKSAWAVLGTVEEDPMNDISKEKAREISEAQVPLRIRDHRLRVDRIKRNAQRRKVHALKPRLSKLDFLAIGDSWFEYPLDDNGVFWPGYNAAIVAQGQLQSMGNPPPLINSIAHHGQPMQAIMGVTNQELMESLVGDDTNWLNGKPDAILVSGGGDDIVGDQFIIYLTYASGGLNASRFQGVLDSVQASYEDLFAFRDEFVPNVPIFGHCYDYAIPNGKPAGLIPIAGPWLWPSLDFAGYDYTEGLQVVKDAIDGFHQMLASLAAKQQNNFHLVDTRGILTRDTSHPLGWANEIHPYFAGFTALAQKFLASLQGFFPGKI